MKKITVLIPCFNEERGISRVLSSMPHDQLATLGVMLEVIVIDNNSTDRTADRARKAGAFVISESRQGKGNALKTGFSQVPKDSDFVIILDGDNTYLPSEMLRMVEPLMHNFCHVVIGSRLSGKMKAGALKSLNRLGNWFFTFLVRTYYQVNITDALSGYIAMKREVVDTIKPYLESSGFEIEMELLTKLSRFGFSAYSVPITYDQRSGSSKLRAVRDGYVILKTFFRNTNWHPQEPVRLPALEEPFEHARNTA